ncbi:MAG: efflux RND transporter permease subunit [Planctomycetales bacterium]|nr:efflux RND transporter permease subunit [Planctomycetales bacterium]
MKSIVRWAIENTPGVNVVVVGTLVAGLISFLWLRREVFPEFELEVVLVQVAYPGASPSDAEKGVCQPIEEAIRSLDGIKRLVSIAREGGGYVMVELNSNVGNVQKVVTEIRSRVDRITNFPDLAEDPQVEQITFREAAIRLAVIGPPDRSEAAELRLREVAEDVRSAILDLSNISQANIQGAKKYQIDVELSEDTLRKYGLTLSRVAQILRRENIEMPGGQLRADGQEILLRGKNRREFGEEISSLPIISQPNGVVLKLSDIGKVYDQFDDSTSKSEVNGQPALVISIDRTADEDLLKIADSVHKFASSHQLPDGFALRVWGDTSVDVRDRMRLLRNNGMQGLCFVFLLLAFFLEFRLAFWVSLGIPISVFGAGIFLLGTGQTLNMLSMFAFLMALGIVVDDAIVVGENIYAHRGMGKNYVQAAIDGTVEVMPSVITAVLTTIIAFIPFFFVSGVMGKFIAVMPVAIIAMLLISLVEAATALPCHLSHRSEDKAQNLLQHITHGVSILLRPVFATFDWLSHIFGNAMDRFGDRIYIPVLRFLLLYPLMGVALGMAVLLVTVAVVNAGWIPFNAFPKSDSNQILAQIVYPDGTPVEITDASTKRIEKAIRDVSEEIFSERSKHEDAEVLARLQQDPLSPRGPVKLTFRQVGQVSQKGAMGSAGGGSGSHVGQVYVELEDAGIRSKSSTELVNLWRQKAGEFSGAERVTFDSASVGPGGNPIEFKILAPEFANDQLEAAVEDAKAELATYAGVYDIRDDATPGKLEFQIRVKDQAQSMGVTAADLAETVRNVYYGAEVMRLQRGRHEVKLMVRYPENERTSLAQFQEIRVRGNDGIERPITELAEITVTRGYSEINRLDQQRSITVITDLDASETNAQFVISKLKSDFLPKLYEKYPQVSVRWEGQQQQTVESMQSLFIGSGLALLAMYVLLVIEFRSYFQPLLILAIVPFGFIGAIWGHGIMGIEVTLFSFFGLVALTGVVVNDSIVLVDFINARVRSGMDQHEALLEAGRRRLRPVFLTSLTTIGGLVPMLTETSFQAQFLVPMATSIAFGLMLSTVVVLFQVPVFFQIYLIVSHWLGFDQSKSRTEKIAELVGDSLIAEAAS